jgi:hypothetical protein
MREERPMIGPKVFAKMEALAIELLGENQENMKKAEKKSDDGKLAVKIAFDIAPGKASDSYEIDATISYTMEKVKSKRSAKVSESQGELPLPEGTTKYPLDKKK